MSGTGDKPAVDLLGTGKVGCSTSVTSSARQPTAAHSERLHDPDWNGKWAIRQKIWNYLEDHNLANAPRPCHHRIPNFEGAAKANDKLALLEPFKRARSVKVSPDKPQEQARFLVLERNKELLVPTPQLRNGLLNRVIPPPGSNKAKLRQCCTALGVKENSQEIGLKDKVTIDLLVVGSVGVSRSGIRIGKGKGYADLEYGMLRSIGAVDESTVVVTTVHDCQVVDIPEELVEKHDMTVDFILTPSEIIVTSCSLPKPTGICWNSLDQHHLSKIPVLRQLRDLEEAAGKNVLLKGQTVDQASEGAHKQQAFRFKNSMNGSRIQDRPYRSTGSPVPCNTQPSRGGRHTHLIPASPDNPGEVTAVRHGQLTESASAQPETVVWVGGLPPSLRVRELKAELGILGIRPDRLVWHGGRGFCFLHFNAQSLAHDAVSVLTGREIKGSFLRMEIAKRTDLPGNGKIQEKAQDGGNTR